MQIQPLTAFVVDDERLARLELRRLLEEFPREIRVIGEAESKKETLEFLQNPPDNTLPDVIFLDINMPSGSGFELLEDVEYDNNGQNQMEVVFVTAYDEYAVRAFEVNVLDYLLKPVDPQRLERTIVRLWKKKRSPAGLNHDQEGLKKGWQKISGFPESHSTAEPNKLTMNDYLFVTIGKFRHVLQLREILCITASDNYTELWCANNKRAVMLRTMNEWESALPEQQFQRIHRSTIINLLWLDTTHPIEHDGALQVVLRGIAEPFGISRRYFAKVKEKFHLSLKL